MGSHLTPPERACALSLSDLFLDAGLQDWQLQAVAEELAELPLQLEEIEAFLWKEVFPVLIWNLVAHVGQWGGFTEEEVCDPIDARRANRFFAFLAPITSRIQSVLWSGMIVPRWEDVKQRLVIFEI